MSYKLLQLTNNNIGTQVANTYLPFGVVTGRINCPYRLDGSISVATSLSDTIVIGTSGHYKITYNPTLVAADAGVLTVALFINGTEVYSTSVNALAGGSVTPTLVYEFKAKCDLPTNVQIQLQTVGISSGISNTIIEKVY